MIRTTRIKKHLSRNPHHADSHRKPTDQPPYKLNHYIQSYRPITKHLWESAFSKTRNGRIWNAGTPNPER